MKSPLMQFKFLVAVLLLHCQQQHLQVKANDFKLLAATVANEEAKPAKFSTLKLAHVIFRHGIRTPVNTYPKDPYRTETFQPYGWGHLTNDGKKDLFQMGKWLARRYQLFLPAYYKPDSIYARSTASPRTLMSMATVLAGMLPPNNTPMKWNTKLNWQPIPIFSEPLDKDIELRMQTACPAYEEMRSNITQEQSSYKGLYEELTKLTGENVTKPSDVNSIFITLWAEQLYGLKLPTWTRNYYPEKMRFLAEQSYADLVSTIDMQRIKAGPLIKLLTDQMLAKINGTLEPADRKLFLYSAHDWTITNLLIALKVWKRQMPNFAALILVELHQKSDNEEYHVELFYQNGPKSSLEALILPGCTMRCPLNRVLELIEDVLPTDTYEEMCNNYENL